ALHPLVNEGCSPRLAANRLLILLKLERAAVEAVAQARRIRAVVEHVPEVTAAAGAADLGAGHSVGGVGEHLYVLGQGRLVEARPAGARLELRVGAEQRSAAPGAVVHAIFLDIPVLAGERALGALLAQHLVLLGRELVTPLGVGLLALWRRHVSPCDSGSGSKGSAVASGSGSPTGLFRAACGSRSRSSFGGLSFASSGLSAASCSS